MVRDGKDIVTKNGIPMGPVKDITLGRELVRGAAKDQAILVSKKLTACQAGSEQQLTAAIFY